MFKHLFDALKAYSGALALISKLNLWRYFAIPMAISIVVGTLIITSAYGFSDDLGHWIADFWLWDFGREFFTTISSLLGGLIILALGLILFKHIIMALSAPFMSPVSEKIEQYLTGQAKVNRINSSFQSQLWRGIRINGRNLILELLITIPILLLKFIPVINIFSTILLFLVQAYYAGFGNIDYTLERHFSYRQSIAFVKQRKGLAIGNGIGFLLILLVPFVGVILVLPLCVTAASAATVKTLHPKS